jgi:hypothetical protein
MKKAFFLILISFWVSHISKAQGDSLLDAIDQKVPVDKYVDATFKSSRLVNFHTVETTGKRTLDFKISHRFGDFSGGVNSFFGIDGPANIRIGLEYSPDGRIQAGIGRTSYQKVYDGFLKYKLWRQRTDNHMPVTVTLLAGMYITGDKDPTAAYTGFDHYQYFTSRMSYGYQILIARKFSDVLSVQVAPSMIHKNLAENITDQNDIYALVGMARYKFTKRMAIGVEYGYRLSKYTHDMSQYHNSIGVSLEIETGGHVFQIVASNSFGLVESQTIPYTSNDITKGKFMLGFNIGRFFTL